MLGLATWAAFGRSWTAAAFVVLAPAAFFSLWLGQSGMLVSALLIAGIGFLERRPVLAGVLFGLLTVKPTLGLLLPFVLVAGGHWRVVLSAMATTGLLIGVSLAFYGLDGWTSYLIDVPSYQMSFHAGEDNLVVNLAPTVFMAVRLLGFDSALGYGAQALVTLITLAVLVWAFHQKRDFGLNGALLMVGTVLASPFVHSYDMSFVTAAVLLLLLDMARHGVRAGERSLAVLTWLLPFLVYFLNGAAEIPIGPVILALLFGAILRRLIARARERESSHLFPEAQQL